MKPNNNISKKQQKNKYSFAIPKFGNEKAQKFTTIVLTFIVSSLFGLLAINPTLSTIAKLKKELEDSRFVHDQLQKKINTLSFLQQEYTRIENDLPFVFDAIPQNPEVPTLISQLQAVAKKSNIRLSNVENFQVELFKQNTSSQKPYSYSFSLEGSGLYQDIENFLEQLINMERVIDIDLISISKTTNLDGSLKLNIAGITYYKN